MAAGVSLAFDRNRFRPHGTHVRRAAFAAGIIAMPWHAKWCAATPQDLIEVNALQTKQGEWRVMWPVRHARPSLLPSQQLVETFKLFGLPAHCDSSHANPKHTHFLLTIASTYHSLTLKHPSNHFHHRIHTPHHNSISLNSIVNMRSFVVFGVAALVASVAGQTGKVTSLGK